MITTKWVFKDVDVFKVIDGTTIWYTGAGLPVVPSVAMSAVVGWLTLTPAPSCDDFQDIA